MAPSSMRMARRGKKSRVDPFKLFAVHLRKDEAAALDQLEGNPKFKGGMRSYAALAPLFEDPEVRESFLKVHEDLEQDDPAANALADEAHQVFSSNFSPAPADGKEPVKSFAEDGEGGDTLLCWMPLNMLIFFSRLNGGLSMNADGLYQLGGSSSNPIKAVGKVFESVGRGVRDTVKNPGNFARTLGAVTLGAVLGGPVGAAGGLLGHLREQGNGKKGGLWGALQGATLAKGLEGGLGMLGYNLPSGAGIPGLGAIHGMTSSLGNMGSSAAAYAGLPHAGSSGVLGSLGMAAQGLMAPASAAAASAGAAGTAGAAGAAGAAAPAAGGLMSGLKGIMGGSMLPLGLLAGAGALGYLGSQKDYKREKEEYERNKRDEEERLRKMGAYDKWVEPAPLKYRRNPYGTPTSSELETGYYPRPGLEYERRASGGRATKHAQALTRADGSSHLIQGPGKGQDDVIPMDVPSGTYIIDASTVGMLGDGSSEAGAKALSQAIASLRHKRASGGKAGMRHASSPRSANAVKLLVSNQEYKIAPEDVSAFGNGNNDAGAALLKKVVKEVRRHKASRGDGLPPKAKSPLEYLARAQRR